jgi:hypothetical protein
MTNLRKRIIAIAGTAALACSVVPLAAAAQTPSYAHSGGQTISGTVASVNGKYDISVRDDRGYIDNVMLHDGTIINPTGLTLAPGEQVTIAGTPDGSAFVANQIDTPYSAYASPYNAYPVYPYPAYGIGLRFGGFGFGFRR